MGSCTGDATKKGEEMMLLLPRMGMSKLLYGVVVRVPVLDRENGSDGAGWISWNVQEKERGIIG